MDLAAGAEDGIVGPQRAVTKRTPEITTAAFSKRCTENRAASARASLSSSGKVR
jgi:hypothetical protein